MFIGGAAERAGIFKDDIISKYDQSILYDK